jgi:hypothetical protein
MDGPWYECSGPDSKYVRDNVSGILDKFTDLQKYQKLGNEYLLLKKNEIEKIIPDDRNDFGSYRGYASFGMGMKLAEEIHQKLLYQCALKVIENKFVPIIIEKFYRPGGKIMKKTAEKTLVGKK